MRGLVEFGKRLSMEPPFRLLTRALVKRFPVSVRTKALWDVVPKPQYLAGVLQAADQATEEGVREISVFEFGVAGGKGLIALGNVAAAVEAETSVRIKVYGFDSGSGLPEFIGDYRDHPDNWQAGDFVMDQELLRRRLRPNTDLVMGNIGTTLPEFIERLQQPIGFVAVDVDLYSSTRDVLQMFTTPGRKMLRRVAMYFSDVDYVFNHRYAGELLAIDEFNRSNANVKIDRWTEINRYRPFPEAPWLKELYMAHDLEAISKVKINTGLKILRIDGTTEHVLSPGATTPRSVQK